MGIIVEIKTFCYVIDEKMTPVGIEADIAAVLFVSVPA